MHASINAIYRFLPLMNVNTLTRASESGTRATHCEITQRAAVFMNNAALLWCFSSSAKKCVCVCVCCMLTLQRAIVLASAASLSRISCCVNEAMYTYSTASYRLLNQRCWKRKSSARISAKVRLSTPSFSHL
jgi:hypothetical protein